MDAGGDTRYFREMCIVILGVIIVVSIVVSIIVIVAIVMAMMS